MGDPRKHRKQYSTPSVLWNRERIDTEKELSQEFGFKNRREIWKASSLLRKFKRNAKDLIAAKGSQAEIERNHLLARLSKIGLVDSSAKLDNVLDIGFKSIAERRLQSLLHRKGFARSMKQARQFITHRHVLISGKVITAPSYLVSKAEENSIQFVPTSALASPQHPERAIPELKEAEKIKEEISKKKEEIEAKEKISKNKEEVPDIIEELEMGIEE